MDVKNGKIRLLTQDEQPEDTESRPTAMVLSPDQQTAHDAILDWVANPSRSFSLSGFAGTGKSLLVGVIGAELVDREVKVAYVAYTGKASLVLRSKLLQQGIHPDYCGTIHRLIYRPVTDPDTGELVWSLVDELPYDLIVLDEASMVGRQLYEDLSSYGVPILAVGDHGQLPPVGEDTFSLVEHADVSLEKIHRQAAGNPVIDLSRHIRETGRYRGFRPSDDRVRFVRSLQPEIQRTMSESDCFGSAVLGYTNATRISFNDQIRQLRARSKKLQPSDVVICLKNAYMPTGMLANGSRGVVLSVQPDQAPILQVKILFPDDACIYEGPVNSDQFGRRDLLNVDTVRDMHPDQKIRNVEDLGLLFDYGYSLTTHKCLSPDTFVETPDGLCVLDSLADSEGQIATPEGRAAYRGFVRNPSGHMLTVTTEDGYSIVMTPQHGMDRWNPDVGYQRVEASDLAVGDWLRIRPGAEFPHQVLQPLPGPPSVPATTPTYRLPSHLTVDVAELFGLIVSRGTLLSQGFQIRPRRSDTSIRAATLVQDCFGLPATTTGSFTHSVNVHSNFIRQWLSDLGVLALTPGVPDCVLRSSTAVQAAFLRGLFDSSSHMTRDQQLTYVEWPSSYEGLRRQVRHLLLRLGICTRAVRHQRVPALQIRGRHLELFRTLIGFSTGTDDALLTLPVAPDPTDLLPLRASESAADVGYVSRDSDHGRTLHDRLPFHHTRIKTIVASTGPSVCVEVPDGHQFIQNGFCGWNSQGSSFDTVLLDPYVPHMVDDDTARRWWYTSVTRAAKNLILTR